MTKTFYDKHHLTPYLFLDNHDTNRFLFECKYDKSLVDEAIELMENYPECDMTNHSTIINAEDYADLRVQEPMLGNSCYQYPIRRGCFQE